ncbi:MAG: beta-ketoacyl-ACP synthase II [Chloroflexaceae bacterium]|nr:beta-ketoacyl-ACP synthase II [Chloroflexaceae bacterium]
MAQTTTEKRERLREQLLAWALTRDVETKETIADQIDHLLEEVLHQAPDTQAALLRLDADDDDERVVITGLGLVTPFGIGIAPFWNGLSTGRSAIGPITLCDVSDSACKIAGEVRGFDPHDFMEPKEARRMSRGSQFAVAAARLAVVDAELEVGEWNTERIGVLVACGSTSYPETEQAIQALLERGPQRVSPFYIPMALPNMSAAQVAIQLRLRGYISSISTACAAGSQAIGEAASVIRRGEADIMLAGGAEAPISRITLASFSALRALSRQNEEPARASRPFDVQRDGFVPAEGAGILILERLSHARERGARIYAELIGYATTSDAFHLTAPDPLGEGAARAMQRALHVAQIDPQQVDYINAHATSTQVGDVAETLAIKQVFGAYAYSVPISASKSMFGHLTGAAGAVEAAASVLALKHGVLPPTINLDDPDPQCDLDYIPHTARQADVQTVMSNSFGFGGVNAVLVFQQVARP